MNIGKKYYNLKKTAGIRLAKTKAQNKSLEKLEALIQKVQEDKLAETIHNKVIERKLELILEQQKIQNVKLEEEMNIQAGNII